MLPELKETMKVIFHFLHLNGPIIFIFLFISSEALHDKIIIFLIYVGAAPHVICLKEAFAPPDSFLVIEHTWIVKMKV